MIVIKFMKRFPLIIVCNPKKVVRMRMGSEEQQVAHVCVNFLSWKQKTITICAYTHSHQCAFIPTQTIPSQQ
jgi:hypothetical protein